MTNEKLQTTIILLTLRQLMQRTGLSRSGIYLRFDPKSPYFDPAFPRRVRLTSSKSIRFVESEVNAYLEQCIAASRQDSHTSQPLVKEVGA
ncbi:AlpA family phage regulatory protein [Pseudomonas sp. CrR25]|nr:AlpA family phage regulatory protein [Pseudomonas sp. CrR25]